MTVIACKISKKHIELACDNQTTHGTHKYPKHDTSDRHIKANGKIFEVNGMTIGCAGSVGDIGLLQIYCKTHQPKEMERDCILDWLIEFKEWANNKAKVNYNDITVHGIIVKENRVFSFFDWMEVREIKDFTAIGSGTFLAIGAMECGASAKRSVEVAIKYDLYCGGKASTIKI